MEGPCVKRRVHGGPLRESPALSSDATSARRCSLSRGARGVG